MAGFEEDMTLVRGWGAQKTEERLLTSFERAHRIVSPIDHQDRDLDVWREVDGIHFRWAAGIATSIGEDGGLESRFEGQGNRTFGATPAETVKGQTIVVNIGASLEIVQRTSHVFRSLNCLIAK